MDHDDHPDQMNAAVDADSLRQRVIDAVQVDPRLRGLLDYGSRSEGRDDEWSDVDLAVFIRDEEYDAFERGWTGWAAGFGPLLLAFVGDIDNHWVVYDRDPLPLRADYHLHRATVADGNELETWPNAPLSVEHMLLVDKDGTLRSHVERMVGRDLGPPDPAHRCELVIAGFWYYAVRTWCKLQRGPSWGVRFDISFIMHGSLMALLRLEAGRIERWSAGDAATDIERDISAERLAAMNDCIPTPDPASLAPALARIVRLGVAASAGAAERFDKPWPEELAARMVELTESSLPTKNLRDSPDAT